jgi:hypothetical protein
MQVTKKRIQHKKLALNITTMLMATLNLSWHGAVGAFWCFDLNLQIVSILPLLHIEVDPF